MENGKKYDLFNRTLVDYQFINNDCFYAQTLKLKKRRLCTNLLAYIKLLAQYQRKQIKGFETNDKEAINYNYKLDEVSKDLDFELQCLHVYKNFLQQFSKNPRWVTTLE